MSVKLSLSPPKVGDLLIINYDEDQYRYMCTAVDNKEAHYLGGVRDRSDARGWFALWSNWQTPDTRWIILRRGRVVARSERPR